MALRVWLPLNGTLENKGISEYTFSSSNYTLDNNGKIGKCYKHLNCNITNLQNLQVYPMTIAFWMKSSDTTSSWQKIMMFDNESGSQIHGIYVADPTRVKYEYKPSLNLPGVSPSEWHHYAFVIDNGQSYGYYDGILSTTSSETITLDTLGKIRIGEGNDIYLNDVRIYDDCLSAKEVKEISQGLVLHYKLNDNIQTLNNCYSYPTFDTSSANGGWSHWGRSGSAGSHGQNTDKMYIYNKQNTYSHWISDDSTATGEYLVYQAPAFEGGYRSLQAIIKEENSRPIDETVCFPEWNARNGGTALYIWTSITSLGDGFYLCKCEGISQDGSNDLVGIYVKPGYKIYISEAYLENNKEMCSEILFPRNYIIDSSGYGYYGTITGTLSTESDSNRYEISTHYSGSSYTDTGSGTFNWFDFSQCTLSAWIKSTASVSGWSGSIGIQHNQNAGHKGFTITDYANNFRVVTVNGSYTTIDSGKQLTVGEWHHCAAVLNGTNLKMYYDGAIVKESTISWGSAAIATDMRFATGVDFPGSDEMFTGNYSDIRMYCTALSAEDILDLYHTSANVDDLGNLHGFEFVEDSTDKFSILKNGVISVTSIEGGTIPRILNNSKNTTPNMWNASNNNASVLNAGTIVNNYSDEYGYDLTIGSGKTIGGARISYLGFNGGTGPYTFSAYIKADKNVSVNTDFCDANATPHFGNNITTEWRYYAFTVNNVSSYNTPGNYNGFFDITFSGTEGDTLYIRSVKVEQNDVPTQWVPHIDDTNFNFNNFSKNGIGFFQNFIEK